MVKTTADIVMAESFDKRLKLQAHLRRLEERTDCYLKLASSPVASSHMKKHYKEVVYNLMKESETIIKEIELWKVVGEQIENANCVMIELEGFCRGMRFKRS